MEADKHSTSKSTGSRFHAWDARRTNSYTTSFKIINLHLRRPKMSVFPVLLDTV